MYCDERDAATDMARDIAQISLITVMAFEDAQSHDSVDCGRLQSCFGADAGFSGAGDSAAKNGGQHKKNTQQHHSWMRGEGMEIKTSDASLDGKRQAWIS